MPISPRLTALFLIPFIAVIIYFNTLQGEFIFDDYDYIANNIAIKNIHNIKELFQYRESRFITMLTFALNYHFHQLNVLGYHLTNVLIHIITGFFIYWFINITLSSPRLKNDYLQNHKYILGLSASLLFISHPIQTQAVSYITQRFESLAAMFYIGAITFYAQSQVNKKDKNSPIFFGLFILFSILGLFSKETSITIPIAIAIYHYLFIQPNIFKKHLKLHLFKIIFSAIGGFCILVGFLFIVQKFKVYDLRLIFLPQPSYSYPGETVSGHNYLLTQLRAIGIYLKLFIFPIGQNLDYHFSLSKSLFTPITTLLSLLALIMLTIYAIKNKKNNPLITFGIFWFFLTISVTSSFLPIRHVIFEHRMYLPSIGLFIAVANMMIICLKSEKSFIKTIIIVVSILSILTIERNKVWQNSIAMWQDVIKKSPLKARPYNNLGTALLEKKKGEEALSYFYKSIELNTADIGIEETYNNIGNAYHMMKDYNNAIKAFELSLQYRPDQSAVYNNLGLVYLDQHDLDKAESAFKKALEIGDAYIQIPLNLAHVYRKKKQYEKAIAVYKEILRINPLNSHADFMLIQAYLENNDTASAEKKAYSLLKQLKDSEKLAILGVLFAEKGVNNIAFQLLSQSLEINPHQLYAYQEIGKILGNIGHYEKAIIIWQEGLKYNPDNPDLKNLIHTAQQIKK